MSRQNGHISEQVRTHISNCVQLVSLFDSSVISIKYEQAEVSVKRFMSQCKLVMQHPLWSCPLTVIDCRVSHLHTDDDNLILTDELMWILRGETWTIFFENSSHDETAVHADCLLLEYVYVNEQTGQLQSSGYSPSWLSLLFTLIQQEVSVSLTPANRKKTWSQEKQTVISVHKSAVDIRFFTW